MRQREAGLKVLLSAFACEPNRGSEMGVGWNWALSLAQAGHQVVVLTRSESRAAIERVMKSAPPDINLRFEYCDVARMLRWYTRGPLHVHFALWQWLAVRVARRLQQREGFDCVHHVTFAGLRAPSFMGTLGIPFILGPVGGGERAPWRLRRGYSLSGLLEDAARDVANLAIQFTPFMVDMFASADRIYVTSRETLGLMPRRFRDKVHIELAIGAEEEATPLVGRIVPLRKPPRRHFRILYAGRFIDCKGMHLGLPAFARLVQAEPQARLTMVGEGPAGRRWRKLVQDLGVAASVDWLPWQNRDGMTNLYAEHDILLFPALHDSGGMVALEAMNHGLPVVCLKLGGPAILVDETCGYAVDPAGKNAVQVVEEMGDALIGLVRESARQPLAQAARMRCRDFSWRTKVMRIYGQAS
jgi:glycosyltransferase involved in cell wall biosynthesis